MPCLSLAFYFFFDIAIVSTALIEGHLELLLIQVLSQTVAQVLTALSRCNYCHSPIFLSSEAGFCLSIKPCNSDERDDESNANHCGSPQQVSECSDAMFFLAIILIQCVKLILMTCWYSLSMLLGCNLFIQRISARDYHLTLSILSLFFTLGKMFTPAYSSFNS